MKSVSDFTVMVGPVLMEALASSVLVDDYYNNITLCLLHQHRYQSIMTLKVPVLVKNKN